MSTLAAVITIAVSTMASASAADAPMRADRPYEVAFAPEQARYVRVVLHGSSSGQEPCIDELEVYGPERDGNLASAESGGRATASSCLPGYGQHAVKHLNDGRYGNERSWIPATAGEEWAQVELPEPALVARVVLSRDRSGRYHDRVPLHFDVLLSLDGETWTTVRSVRTRLATATLGTAPLPPVPAPPPPPKRDQTGRLVVGTALRPLVAPRSDELGSPNLALEPAARPSASSVYLDGALAIHQIAHLTDGLSGNSHSWIAKTTGPEWAEVDLGEVYWVYRVALASDNAGQYNDRAAVGFRVLTAEEYAEDSDAAAWRAVFEQRSGPALHLRREITFRPTRARYVRVLVTSTTGGEVRIDELEVYGRREPVAAEDVGALTEAPRPAQGLPEQDLVATAFIGEEHAWLKTYGRADLDPSLVPYNGRVTEYPRHVGDDVLPLPPLDSAPVLDGELGDPCWLGASAGTARVAYPDDYERSPLVEYRVLAGRYHDKLCIAVTTDRLLSSHVAVVSTGDARVCGVVGLSADGGLVFTEYSARGEAVAVRPVEGAYDSGLRLFEFAMPLTWLAGYEETGLRVGLGMGGRHTSPHGRPVAFAVADLAIAQDGPCVDGKCRVRVSAPATASAVRLWAAWPGVKQELHLTPGDTRVLEVVCAAGPLGPQCSLDLSAETGQVYALNLFRYDPLARPLELMADLVTRLGADGLDVSQERDELDRYQREHKRLMAGPPDAGAERAVAKELRLAKRRLLLRAPDLAAATRLLFVKRHAYHPSHIYTDYTDAPFRPGGGIHTIEIPRRDGRLDPGEATVTCLFDAGGGIARDPAATYDLSTIYFGYRPSEDGFYHIMAMGPDGSGLRKLTDGPYHDFYPCPLPAGDIAFISTRCTARVFCFRGASSTLHRMDPDGRNIRALSYASLSEWAPSVMRDGRIIWTRWEYVDKGADFSQTLWSVRPDGTGIELVFGNTILQPNGYASGREVPGTSEILCTLVSHFGDINGPLALVDTDQGRMNPAAIRSITPEVPWPGWWPSTECFRDPYPLSRDYFLCSHAPWDQFGLYVVDRYGNREALYLDPSIGSMAPTPFHATGPPPVLPDHPPSPVDEGTFILMDVYAGLTPTVARGAVKWLRVVEEVRHNIAATPNFDHADFMKWYASPVDVVNGPYGWPSYVAKAPLGLVPVSEDGSAHFVAPAGKNIYFQVLDADYNELQRMRSLVQLQPGETRTCSGCHESRSSAPPVVFPLAEQREPVAIRPHSFGPEPFSYERSVQPVLDAKCVACHDDGDESGVDLTARLDENRVPASYRTLISGGYVHFADCGWNSGGNLKLEPLSFGTVMSPLWEILDRGHYGVELTEDEVIRIKTWTDLNCPLWPDYVERSQRPGPEAVNAAGAAG